LKLEWDELLSPELYEQWILIAEDLTAARDNQINRKYFDKTSPGDTYQMHTFADASTSAYGAVVFLRRQHETALVMSKTRVAPKSELSLPKLELMAALIATRLGKLVLNALSDKFNITEHFLWSDSQATLHWINSSKKLPVFVQNRVQEIRDFTQEYKYCPTVDNPADLLTRGISANDLRSNPKWNYGPSWLPDQQMWPTWDVNNATQLHVNIMKEDDDLVNPDTTSPVINAQTAREATDESDNGVQRIIDIIQR
uniref:Uncharacterized protein LOC102801229 n=1 Tax=Saccoglossus kowalevskii TaxID=10224 RepID=A0ABM0M1F4_SACKO